MTPPSDSSLAVPPRWLRWGFRLLALALGALHTAMAVRSQSMNEDGIGYLDLGDAWWQGHWDAVVNTTWSPLYAWIVGGVVNLTDPSVWWEFPTVQITNFGIYALALLCFEYFWRQLTVSYYVQRPGDGEVLRIPPVPWFAIGYSLFIYVSLNLIEIWAATPDMCVAAFVYLAAGQLLKLDDPNARPSTALWLGVVLGLGYLAKAALFPLGVVCILLAVLMRGGGLGRRPRLGLTLAAFLLVSGPWVAAVSNSVGHLAFSDVGRFAYLKHVNQVPWPPWQEAADRVNGTPIHPPRQIHADPAVWEFATPIGGTYPLAYDPAWWTRGLEPRVEVGPQLQAIATNAVYYFELFVRRQGGFLAVVLVLCVLSLQSVRRPPRLDGAAALVLWALAALGLYCLVYAEARYIAPFVLILWAGLLARVRLPAEQGYQRVATVSGVVLALLVWVNIGALNLEGLSGALGLTPPQHEEMAVAATSSGLADGPEASHPEIAGALRDTGLKEGARVAFIGYSYSAYWARLARAQIAAEIRPEDTARFWMSDIESQERIFAELRRMGVAAVIAEPPPAGATLRDWRPIGSAGYQMRLL